MAEIPLTRGLVALVDDEDYQNLSAYKWQAAPAAAGNIYAKRRGRAGTNEPATVLMHRQIMGSPAGLDVDHANHNTLDNRRSNLKAITHAENLAHRRPWWWRRFGADTE